MDIIIPAPAAMVSIINSYHIQRVGANMPLGVLHHSRCISCLLRTHRRRQYRVRLVRFWVIIMVEVMVCRRSRPIMCMRIRTRMRRISSRCCGPQVCRRRHMRKHKLQVRINRRRRGVCYVDATSSRACSDLLGFMYILYYHYRLLVSYAVVSHFYVMHNSMCSILSTNAFNDKVLL